MLLRLRNSVASMTGMSRAQERTANNLANAGTIGFKRERAFVEVLNEQIDTDGGPHSNRAIRQWIDFSTGQQEKTGNAFDLSLNGDGFFVLSDPESDELRYTRAGRMNLSEDGTLQSLSGMSLEGEGGPIQIPPGTGEVEVRPDGRVFADGNLIAQLSVVNFEDTSVLQRRGGAEFSAGDAQSIESSATVRQGYVEHSNTEPLEAMTGMIEHLRLFEMQQRMLRSTDENLSQSIRSLGRF
jgi:flagellar basal-body rod protein FlgF